MVSGQDLIHAIDLVRDGKARRLDLHTAGYDVTVYRVSEFVPVRIDFKVKGRIAAPETKGKIVNGKATTIKKPKRQG